MNNLHQFKKINHIDCSTCDSSKISNPIAKCNTLKSNLEAQKCVSRARNLVVQHIPHVHVRTPFSHQRIFSYSIHEDAAKSSIERNRNNSFEECAHEELIISGVRSPKNKQINDIFENYVERNQFANVKLKNDLTCQNGGEKLSSPEYMEVKEFIFTIGHDDNYLKFDTLPKECNDLLSRRPMNIETNSTIESVIEKNSEPSRELNLPTECNLDVSACENEIIINENEIQLVSTNNDEEKSTRHFNSDDCIPKKCSDSQASMLINVEKTEDKPAFVGLGNDFPDSDKNTRLPNIETSFDESNSVDDNNVDGNGGTERISQKNVHLGNDNLEILRTPENKLTSPSTDEKNSIILDHNNGVAVRNELQSIINQINNNLELENRIVKNNKNNFENTKRAFVTPYSIPTQEEAINLSNSSTKNSSKSNSSLPGMETSDDVISSILEDNSNKMDDISVDRNKNNNSQRINFDDVISTEYQSKPNHPLDKSINKLNEYLSNTSSNNSFDNLQNLNKNSNISSNKIDNANCENGVTIINKFSSRNDNGKKSSKNDFTINDDNPVRNLEEIEKLMPDIMKVVGNFIPDRKSPTTKKSVKFADELFCEKIISSNVNGKVNTAHSTYEQDSSSTTFESSIQRNLSNRASPFNLREEISELSPKKSLVKLDGRLSDGEVKLSRNGENFSSTPRNYN